MVFLVPWDGELLARMLRGDLRMTNLPEDARIVFAREDFERGCLRFLVSSQTYGVVAPGVRPQEVWAEMAPLDDGSLLRRAVREARDRR